MQFPGCACTHPKCNWRPTLVIFAVAGEEGNFRTSPTSFRITDGLTLTDGRINLGGAGCNLLWFLQVTLAARGLEEPCASFPDFCDNRQFPVIYCVFSRLCTLFRRISDSRLTWIHDFEENLTKSNVRTDSNS